MPWVCILACNAAPMDQAVCGWMKWISVGVSRLFSHASRASLTRGPRESGADDGQTAAGCEQLGAVERAGASSSSLTAIRMAWKVRVAGWVGFVPRASATTGQRKGTGPRSTLIRPAMRLARGLAVAPYIDQL